MENPEQIHLEDLTTPDSSRESGPEAILGPDHYFGPQAIKHAFGIDLPPSEIPPIPFTREELERAKALNQMLLLRVTKAPDGQPLTMEKMNSLPLPQGQDKLLYDTDWYNNEDFFTQETPTAGWALVTKDVIPDSISTNYLEQTQLLINYLQTQVFQGQPLPKVYEEAIHEFEAQKPTIESLIDSDWKKAAEQLENLTITHLLRQTPVEATYDLALVRGTNDEHLLGNMYTWTSRRSSDGGLVGVGIFDAGGVYVDRDRPAGRAGARGVSFSRPGRAGSLGLGPLVQEYRREAVPLPETRKF